MGEPPMKEMEELIKDIKAQRSLELPTGDWVKKLDKIHCDLKIGQRVNWYYEDDKKFLEEHEPGASMRRNPPFSGLVIPIPSIEADGRELEWDDCIIVIDRYPTEKCWPEVEWLALGRLLDREDLVELFGAVS
jgi:hypothetical protein